MTDPAAPTGNADPDTPDADMAAVLARIAALRVGQTDRYSLPFDASRLQLLSERRWWIEAGPVMAEISERLLPSAGGGMRCRTYVPAVRRLAAAPIVYLHGGGWCVGSIDTHDSIMRGLADAHGGPVIGLDYVLAPEFPFPVAALDIERSLELLRDDGSLAADWVLAGDSAGANLALIESIRARDRGEPQPGALLLFYGIYFPLRDSASMRRFGDGRYGLSRAVLNRYEAAYLGGRSGHAVPEAYGTDGSLGGLPPVWLAAAGLDPLLDDSIDLVALLARDGTRQALRLYPAVIHGFLSYARMLPSACQAFADAAAFLRGNEPVPER